MELPVAEFRMLVQPVLEQAATMAASLVADAFARAEPGNDRAEPVLDQVVLSGRTSAMKGVRRALESRLAARLLSDQGDGTRRTAVWNPSRIHTETGYLAKQATSIGAAWLHTIRGFQGHAAGLHANDAGNSEVQASELAVETKGLFACLPCDFGLLGQSGVLYSLFRSGTPYEELTPDGRLGLRSNWRRVVRRIDVQRPARGATPSSGASSTSSASPSTSATPPARSGTSRGRPRSGSRRRSTTGCGSSSSSATATPTTTSAPRTPGAASSGSTSTERRTAPSCSTTTSAGSPSRARSASPRPARREARSADRGLPRPPRGRRPARLPRPALPHLGPAGPADPAGARPELPAAQPCRRGHPPERAAEARAGEPVRLGRLAVPPANSEAAADDLRFTLDAHGWLRVHRGHVPYPDAGSFAHIEQRPGWVYRAEMEPGLREFNSYWDPTSGRH
ncbi:hypothetical protein ACFQ0M_05950 [Kitasatospora aburaviensis]